MLILPSPWRQQPQQAVLVSAEARTAGSVSAPLWSQGVGRVHDPAFTAQQFVNVGGTLKPGQNGVGLNLVAASSQYLKSATIPLNPKNGFTALALIKPASSAPAATNAFFGFGNVSDVNSIVYGFQFATSGHLGIQCRDSAGGGSLITTSQQMLAGNWYSVAVRSNGANSTAVRINGTTYTDATAIGAFTTPDNYTIGGLYRTAIAVPFDGEMHGPWLFNTVLTDSQIDGWLANIWRVYQAPPRRIYVSLPAGGTTVALIGQAMTSVQGTLGVAVDKSMVGQSISSTQGGFTPVVSIPLVGQVVTISQGVLTPVFGVTVPLVGQSVSLSTGSLSTGTSVSMSGNIVTVTPGSFIVDQSRALTGNSVASSLGTISVTLGSNLSGQGVAISQGSLGPSITASIVGQTLIVSLGTLTPLIPGVSTTTRIIWG